MRSNKKVLLNYRLFALPHHPYPPIFKVSINIDSPDWWNSGSPAHIPSDHCVSFRPSNIKERNFGPSFWHLVLTQGLQKFPPLYLASNFFPFQEYLSLPAVLVRQMNFFRDYTGNMPKFQARRFMPYKWIIRRHVLGFLTQTMINIDFWRFSRQWLSFCLFSRGHYPSHHCQFQYRDIYQDQRPDFIPCDMLKVAG